MKCVFCKIGETRPRRVAVTRYNEAADVVALVHHVPTEACDYCGEERYQATDWEKVEELLAKKPPVRITPILVYTLGAWNIGQVFLKPATCRAKGTPFKNSELSLAVA